MIIRRLIWIFIALAVPLVVLGGVALATYHPGLPDVGQEALDSYLNQLRQEGRPAKVAGESLANYPRSFTPDLSGPSFGNGYYFFVTNPSRAKPLATSSSPLAGASITFSVGSITPTINYGGERPLPYPPDEVWCVRLKPDTTSGGRGAPPSDVVLVARHGDLFVDTWVVHELPPDTAAQTVAAVACAAK